MGVSRQAFIKLRLADTLARARAEPPPEGCLFNGGLPLEHLLLGAFQSVHERPDGRVAGVELEGAARLLGAAPDIVNAQ